MKINKIVILVALMISASSMAQLTKPQSNDLREITGGTCSAPIPIPDDGYDGSIGSMACVDVVGPGGVITDMSLDIAIDHTWVGDLVIKVVAPAGQVLTVMSRPGLDEVADDGLDCCGSQEDLNNASPLNFSNGGDVPAEMLGVSDIGDNVICQDDGLCSYSPSPGAGVGTDFSDFFGMESAGTWQICVGDSVLADIGQLCDDSTLNFTAGPPPSGDVMVNPTAGTNLNFGSGGGSSGSSFVTIINDATAAVDITNVNCSFSGGDAGNFNVDTLLPGGPISPGGSLTIDMSATVDAGENLASTLICTYDGDVNNTSSSWPVSISGRALVIPTLGFYGILGLITMVLFGAVVARRKFI